MPGNLGQTPRIPFPPIKIPPKRGIDLSTSNPPTILTAPDLDQGEPDGMFNEGTGRFETMNGGARGARAADNTTGGMGTFGGYRKTSFGSGFSPFGSNYSGY